jgi:hypothetical protein
VAIPVRRKAVRLEINSVTELIGRWDIVHIFHDGLRDDHVHGAGGYFAAVIPGSYVLHADTGFRGNHPVAAGGPGAMTQQAPRPLTTALRVRLKM